MFFVSRQFSFYQIEASFGITKQLEANTGAWKATKTLRIVYLRKPSVEKKRKLHFNGWSDKNLFFF